MVQSVRAGYANCEVTCRILSELRTDRECFAQDRSAFPLPTGLSLVSLHSFVDGGWRDTRWLHCTFEHSHSFTFPHSPRLTGPFPTGSMLNRDPRRRSRGAYSQKLRGQWPTSDVTDSNGYAHGRGGPPGREYRALRWPRKNV